MFHTDLWDVVRHLGAGNVGLEKEGLRVTRDGFMAQTRDPFIGNPKGVFGLYQEDDRGDAGAGAFVAFFQSAIYQG